MIEMLSKDLLPIPKPRVSLTAVWALAVLIATASLALRVLAIERSFPEIEPRGAAILPFAMLFGLGVAAVICLAYANRKRWKAVLHPNKGRLIGAAVLSALTPVGISDGMPLVPAGIFLFFLLLYSSDLIAVLVPALGIMIVLAPLWYAVSCLIVSGIKSRWMRVGLFSLMFWTSYSALLLLSGNQFEFF